MKCRKSKKGCPRFALVCGGEEEEEETTKHCCVICPRASLLIWD
jgi:hypothetical protein